MAKKDYPGLVIVPPSDRTILRRRVVWGSLFLIPAVWIASTVVVWPPTSNDDTDCRDMTGDGSPGNSTEECGRSRATATVDTREDDFSLAHISQAEGQTEPQHSIPSTPLENHRLAFDPTRHEDPTPKPSAPEHTLEDHPGGSSNDEKSAAGALTRKSPSNPNPDAQRAEQGDAFAQYRLGKYYAKQKGRQAPESISWYRKASTGLRRLAEAGNGQAMYVLGVMYAYGRGVARNREEARRWLTQAIQQNVTAAQPVLANLEAKQTVDPKPNGRELAHPVTPQPSTRLDRP